MSSGRNFKYQSTQNLELGKTLSSEYRAMFGKPTSVEVRDTASGKYETANYSFAFISMGSIRVRDLDLEFRDGVLNGFSYLSSFDKDKTSANTFQVNRIQRGISKKSDVLDLLGNPNGMGKYPSYLFDFKNISNEGIELWTWTMISKLSMFDAGSQELTVQTILIGFDHAGVVSDIETVEKKGF